MLLLITFVYGETSHRKRRLTSPVSYSMFNSNNMIHFTIVSGSSLVAKPRLSQPILPTDGKSSQRPPGPRDN